MTGLHVGYKFFSASKSLYRGYEASNTTGEFIAQTEVRSL